MEGQNHFTLSFPMKSPTDATVLSDGLPSLMPALFQAEDAICTIHYSRFTVLNEKTLYFLGTLMVSLALSCRSSLRKPGPCSTRFFSTLITRRLVQSPAMPTPSLNGPRTIFSVPQRFSALIRICR
jgi:hypothetical protein